VIVAVSPGANGDEVVDNDDPEEHEVGARAIADVVEEKVEHSGYLSVTAPSLR
jgi:hypothetical protein